MKEKPQVDVVDLNDVLMGNDGVVAVEPSTVVVEESQEGLFGFLKI